MLKKISVIVLSSGIIIFGLIALGMYEHKKNKRFLPVDGDTIVFDRVTGRYFKSSIEKLKRIENEFNAQLNQGDWICLNDIYIDIGLDPVSIGDDLGWYIHDSGLNL